MDSQAMPRQIITSTTKQCYINDNSMNTHRALMTLNHKHILKLIYHLHVIPNTHTHTHATIKVLTRNMIYIIMIMTVIIMCTVITLIINSNDTIISLSAGVLLRLQTNYCVWLSRLGAGPQPQGQKSSPPPVKGLSHLLNSATHNLF